MSLKHNLCNGIYVLDRGHGRSRRGFVNNFWSFKEPSFSVSYSVQGSDIFMTSDLIFSSVVTKVTTVIIMVKVEVKKMINFSFLFPVITHKLWVLIFHTI